MVFLVDDGQEKRRCRVRFPSVYVAPVADVWRVQTYSQLCYFAAEYRRGMIYANERL